MEPPKSVADPASVESGIAYALAFKDDDWDHWADITEANTYIGYRVTGTQAEPRRNPWEVLVPGGQRLDWTYGDDEVILLRRL